MSTIFPIPQTFTLVDKNGYYTPHFKQYLDQVLARIGGVNGGIYNQITYAANIVWDLDQNPIAVLKLEGNTTITVVNQVAGILSPYRLTVAQDGTGGRLITWGGMFKFPSATAPTLSTGANAVDEILFDSDGTNMKYIGGVKDLR